MAGFLDEADRAGCRSRAVLDALHPDRRRRALGPAATSTSARAAPTPRSTSRSPTESCSAAADVPGAAGRAWQLVYQSRSGPPTQPWLEPDINDAIAELAGRGRQGRRDRAAGLRVSDHMEVLWDLDTEAMDAAAARTVCARCARRPPASHPAYVSGLVDLVARAAATAPPTAERPHETALGPWFDVCRPGCCENVRAGFKPAAAGLAP